MVKYIFILLLLFSCKTKQVDFKKEVIKDKTEIDSSLVVRDTVFVQKKQVNTLEETKQLLQLMQQLNVAYDGKQLDDKLDLLLKKTNEGTRLTISGKGKANYTENQNKQLEAFKVEIIKRQDSLMARRKKEVSELRKEIDFVKKTKDKNVNVVGFQFGFIALIIILYIIKKYLA